MAAWICKSLRTHLRSSLNNPSPVVLLSLSSLSGRSVSSSTQALASPLLEREGRKWSRWLLFLPGAITFGLGTWQISRRQDKIEMLDYRRERLEMEPIMLNQTSLVNKHFDSLEFRRVICHGVFDDKKSIYVGPRSRSISGVTENGYYVITPLYLAMEKSDSLQYAILVNRGWVPRSWRDSQLEDAKDVKQISITHPKIEEYKGLSWWNFWSKKPPETKVQQPARVSSEVIAVIRGSEKPSIFVPENDPLSGQWFYIDTAAIARSVGLPENTIYVEDINENVNASKPYPVPKDVSSLIRFSVMPQDHLNYTLTWYSLSAAVSFMAVKRLKPKKKRLLYL